MLRSSLRAALVAFATSLVLAPIACGESDPTESASEDLTQAVEFEAIDVQKGNAEAGLTVIKSSDAYEEFFGETPPSSVDFKKHWVVHVSTGVRLSLIHI